MEDTVGGWLFGGFKVLGKASLVDPFLTRIGVFGCSERWEPEATERTEPKHAIARAPAPLGRVFFLFTRMMSLRSVLPALRPAVWLAGHTRL
jgi:hypothetical protein